MEYLTTFTSSSRQLETTPTDFTVLQNNVFTITSQGINSPTLQKYTTLPLTPHSSPSPPVQTTPPPS